MMEGGRMGACQRATVPPHSTVTQGTRRPPHCRLTGKINTRRAEDWVSKDSLRLLPSWEMREDIQTPLLERSHSQSKQWMELCQFARVAWVINIWTVAYQECPCGWMVILSTSLGRPIEGCQAQIVRAQRSSMGEEWSWPSQSKQLGLKDCPKSCSKQHLRPRLVTRFLNW